MTLIINCGYADEYKAYMTQEVEAYNKYLRDMKANAEFLKEKLSKGEHPSMELYYYSEKPEDIKYSCPEGYVMLVSDGRVLMENEDEILFELDEWEKKWAEDGVKETEESDSLKTK